VAKFVPEGEPETGRRAREGQKDEEVANGDGSSSDTLDEPDIVHVVGDIVQVRSLLPFFPSCRQQMINLFSPAYSHKD
jgi:hypothetical protein